MKNFEEDRTEESRDVHGYIYISKRIAYILACNLGALLVLVVYFILWGDCSNGR